MLLVASVAAAEERPGATYVATNAAAECSGRRDLTVSDDQPASKCVVNVSVPAGACVTGWKTALVGTGAGRPGVNVVVDGRELDGCGPSQSGGSPDDLSASSECEHTFLPEAMGVRAVQLIFRCKRLRGGAEGACGGNAHVYWSLEE
jgi:hypothetical protein